MVHVAAIKAGPAPVGTGEGRHMGDDMYADVSIFYKDADNELHELSADNVTFDFETIKETAEIATGCIEALLHWFMDEHVFNVSPVKKVVFNDPATVVYWIDGSKTVVKRSEDDEWDPEKGLLLCFMKRMFGNTGRYNDVLKEWMREGE